MFKGFAQSESSSLFLSKKNVHIEQRRRFCDVAVSSIALGTYLGAMDFPTDQAVVKAIRRALSQGVNFIDTAINYRGQRAEKSVGEALKQAFLTGEVQRSEVFVSTKGGFVPYDGHPVEDLQELFHRNYVMRGLVKDSDLIAQCHCMHPRFLDDQINRSRENLGLEAIDLYYLHNPETQLEEYPERLFYDRLFEAFRALEKARREGRIQSYGLATWDGFREPPQSQGYLNLEKIIHTADAACDHGDSGLKAIQLPLNFAMLEARFMGTQAIATGEEFGPEGVQLVSAIEAANAYGIDVALSAPLLQGQLAEELPPFITKHFKSEQSNAEMALRFAVSLSGVAAAMVGMKTTEHVDTNLQVLKQKNLDAATIQDLLKSLAIRA